MLLLSGCCCSSSLHQQRLSLASPCGGDVCVGVCMWWVRIRTSGMIGIRDSAHGGGASPAQPGVVGHDDDDDEKLLLCPNTHKAWHRHKCPSEKCRCISPEPERIAPTRRRSSSFCIAGPKRRRPRKCCFRCSFWEEGAGGRVCGRGQPSYGGMGLEIELMAVMSVLCICLCRAPEKF